MSNEEKLRNCIKAFDMEEFFDRKGNNIERYSGILLITPKQVIIGLNLDNGREGSYYSYANALSVIYNKQFSIDDKTASNNFTDYDNMIHAELINDITGCCIYFSMQDVDSICQEEYDQFMKSYNEYNNILENISKKRKEQIVYYQLGKDVGKSNNLEEIREYLKGIINKHKKKDNERKSKKEKIIEIKQEEKESSYKDSIIAEYKELVKTLEKYKNMALKKEDYKIYEDKIKEIFMEIVEKADNNYTLEEKRTIIIKISIIINDIYNKINANKDT